jgi:hypothetical protein
MQGKKGETRGYQPLTWLTVGGGLTAESTADRVFAGRVSLISGGLYTSREARDGNSERIRTEGRGGPMVVGCFGVKVYMLFVSFPLGGWR